MRYQIMAIGFVVDGIIMGSYRVFYFFSFLLFFTFVLFFYFLVSPGHGLRGATVNSGLNVQEDHCSKFLFLRAEGYLSLENVLLHSSSKGNSEKGSEVGKEEASCSGQDDPLDDASLVQSYDHEVHRFDFHIVYSSSYRVPVLYFRAYRIDGQPLALDDIEKDLSTNSAKLLMESKWTFITQEEHPYLSRPWYTLHPCGTNEWMKLLIDADSSQATGGPRFENYLFSWFSIVGQVFDLRIPVQMLTSFQEL